MSLQTRKLKAIEYLIGLRDEKDLKRIESVIEESRKHQAPRDVMPFTQEQLIKRAQRSTQDYISGKFKTQEQLEKESENW